MELLMLLCDICTQFFFFSVLNLYILGGKNSLLPFLTVRSSRSDSHLSKLSMDLQQLHIFN